MSFADQLYVGIEQYRIDHPYGSLTALQPTVPVQQGTVKKPLPWVYDYDFRFVNTETLFADVQQEFIQKSKLCTIPVRAKFSETSLPLIIKKGYQFQETFPLKVPIRYKFTESIPLTVSTKLKFEETTIPFNISTKLNFNRSFLKTEIQVISKLEEIKRMMKLIDEV